ncbi:hypothetical protein [Streptomyces pharetrae]
MFDRERVPAEGAEIFWQVTLDAKTVAPFDAEYGGPTPAGQAPRAA